MNSAKNKKEKAKIEIEKTELAFSKMAADSGIQIAFAYFASKNAIIKRQNDSLIKGVTGIRTFYNNQKFKKVKLSWKPDFIDVSTSADLGYTYGKYDYSQLDSSGKLTHFKGIFHTVWKKMETGEWKFVWD
jgi:ketosteroid isomerase-like protein